jgi:hypothetical protein
MQKESSKNKWDGQEKSGMKKRERGGKLHVINGNVKFVWCDSFHYGLCTTTTKTIHT